MSGYAPDTLQPADTWREQSACASPLVDPEAMFPSSAPGELDHAKRICGICPVLAECGTWALDKRIEFGVWGGMSEADRRAVLRRRTEQRRITNGEAPRPKGAGQRPPAKCGTTAAYDRHIRKGETPDPECRAAHSRYRVERRTVLIEAAKCGTRNGYRKHRRNNEPACTACRKANADADRRLRNTGTTKAKTSA